MLTNGEVRSRAIGGMKSALGAMRRRIAAAIVLIAALTMVVEPAWAHGQSSKEGYVMVQQAISYLVNEPGPKGTSEALERVDDALTAEDHDGVDIPTLVQAKAELKAGNADAARPLLQSSISEAIASLKPATGEETGTTMVVPPLQRNGSLSGMDWVLLLLSVLAALGGAVLAYLFRPKENLGALGGDIRAASAMVSNGSSAPSSGRDDNVR